MSDLIDRQQAIDYFVTNVGFHDEDGYPIEDECELREIWTGYFDGIPSAQPEPCEDAVSREVLKDGFTKMCNLICPYTKKQQHVMCGSCLMGTAFDVLEATPSVTPKQRTGKWIEYEQKFMTDRPFETIKKHVRECSLCRTKIAGFDGTMRYCPNCGAKMEVTE